MASGSSSTRIGSGSRSFDFGSDDVLCSYDDLAGLDSSNGKRPGSAGGKDFRDTRTGKPLQNVYCQQDGYNKQDMVFLVEKCMQKYTDNLLGVLEGISGRLKQLEVYSYNLEKSVGDLRTDLTHDQSDTDSKLTSLEKHLQEVHRSVQILRDKQELAETQKELAKLQLAQKESSSSPDTENQKKDDTDASNKQLVLALPQQQVVQSSTPAARVPEPQNIQVQQPPYLAQGGGFYSQQQVPNQPPQPQLAPRPQPQAAPQPQPQLAPQPDARYSPQIPRNQDLPVPTPPQQSHVVSQSQGPYPSYPQQWSQQAPQQQFTPISQPQQQASPPVPYSPQGSPYPSYQSPQPVKAPGETFQGNMTMPASYSSIPPPGPNHHEVGPYGYGGPGSSVPQQPLPPHGMQRHTQPPTGQTPPGPQPNKGSGYMSPAPYPQHPQPQGYPTYATDGGGRPAHSPPFYGSVYPPPGPQNQQLLPASARGHPFGDLMEKAVNMGYPRDIVAGAIYRMEESGQPADFNVLLDTLNSRASVPPQRGWTG